MRVNSFEELVDKIDPKFIDKAIDRKNNLINIIKNNLIIYDDNFKWLEIDSPNAKSVLKIFDDFNDFKASERIVNEIENLYV